MDKIEFYIEGQKEPVQFYVVEQTRLAGVNYLLVTEEETGDSEALILKEVSTDQSNEGVFVIVSDDAELDGVVKVFEALLEDVSFESDEI